MSVVVLLCLTVLFGNSFGRELTDYEYYSLPDLYYLDEYEKCLALDGEYCLGTFHLTPMEEPHPVYELMKEYSEEVYTFNHTLIHRGYCITSRCPDLNSTDPSFRFEECTSRIFTKHSLRVNLTTFKYCQTKEDTKIKTIDVAQISYLAVVAVLLAMNVIGTVYDYRMRKNPKKIKFLMAWSAFENWKELTKHEVRKGFGLSALHGIRVMVAFMTCIAHCAVMFYSMYLHSPRNLENLLAHPLSMLVQNSAGAEQMFFVMSGFLYTVQLRTYAEKHRLSYRLLPMLVMKRIIRISPVLLLVVGFAATWWPLLSSGPQWLATVGAESQVCRDKFWTHALFVNNLVRPEQLCVLPTWYMAVDIQMHILSSLVMLLLLRYPRKVLLSLGLLFAAACLLYAALVYIFDWMPLFYLAVSPENIRAMFHNMPSFSRLYIAPWGSVSACFLGLALGHIYYDNKDGNIHLGRYKWLVYASCVVAVPLMSTWVVLGVYFQHIKSKLFIVAYAALERSVFLIVLLLSYVILCVISGFILKLFAWRGWQTLSRMSLSVMTVHWLVNYYLIGASPQPLSSSLMDIVVNGITTAVYTFIFSVPITVLVELPMKNLYNVVFPS